MRPEKHFTPPKGWMNDPNGAILINGEYHIFYQYYPDNIVWGPMHWGHAVSQDLLKWTHLDIALYPDQNGYCFSGSCVLDNNNISGLSKNGEPVLICLYTSHNPDTGEQQQCMAYSYDYQNFIKYENNPVIENKLGSPSYKVDFRDPKVFYNEKTGGYSMVVSAGKTMEFFHTTDFINWEKTGDFTPDSYENEGIGGIVECPDLVCLQADNKKEKWVLLASMIMDEDETKRRQQDNNISNAHVTQYFVGNFDGNTFYMAESSLDVVNMLGLKSKRQKRAPLLIDYGTDNYAMVSFAGVEDINRKLFIGWGEHWDYAAKVPAEEYRGKMTIPRNASLVEIDGSYKLKWSIAPDMEYEHLELAEGENITIMRDGKPSLVISVSDNEIYVMRVKNDKMNFSEYLKDNHYNVFKAKRLFNGKCKIDVLEDNGYYEIFAEDGLLPFSVMTY